MGDRGPAGAGARLLRALCDFILPPHCVVCEASTSGESDPWVCAGCWVSVKFMRPPVCAQCGTPFQAPVEAIGAVNHRCGRCVTRPPHYERARAVGLYEGTLREVIHAMKYRPVFGLVRPLAELLCGWFSVYWGHRVPDALVPVPLHRLRLRRREFDQAQALAGELGRQVGVPVWSDTLIRHVSTRSQIGLSAVERRRNIRGAFRVEPRRSCRGKSLLLIDDVYTTGATALECARVLKRAGAARVDVYTVARVG
ncbi:MAG: ComF family protein [Candidatus Tectomicrobia bacterium]|nr:ComF family protein [Candidatus Tectomicrobia bacterium]